MGDRFIGLDIGGTKCAVLLAEVNHGIHILDKRKFDTCADRGFSHTWERLCAGVDEILEKNGMAPGDVRAIGVSCGGPLDSRRGVIMSPPNLPGWDDIHLADMLAEKYGVPAYVQNDANACALVEWKLGAGRGVDDMVFLTMGTGMGGGVIAGGRLLRGANDMAGEVGHLRLADDGPSGYGKAGSFEGFASGGGIDRQAQAFTRARIEAGAPAQWSLDGHAPESVNAALIADYARRGDPQARAIFEQAGRRLGQGLALIADALNPARIVIGSVFVRCEDLLRGPMEAALAEEALAPARAGLEVVPAQTGERLGDCAAVMAALYALGIDPMEAGDVTDPRVMGHYERLFRRYPQLEGCRDDIMRAYLMLEECYRRGGKLMAVGNGGSCADCEHIAGELMKGFNLKRPLPEDVKVRLRAATDDLLPGAADLFQQGMPAIALTGHAALSTAVQNDLDPIMAPAQQVVALGRPGDVVLGISTSGNAKNVALAIQTAKVLGMKTLGLTGGTGGRLKRICDCAIAVPGECTADMQELHLPIYHALCEMLEAKFFES